MNKKHILITGGTGFIGTNLVRSIITKQEEKYKVILLVRDEKKVDPRIKKKCEIVEIDKKLKTLRERISTIEIDTVIHLATKYIAKHKEKDIEELIDSNILFGLKLIEAISNNQKCVKVLNISTAWSLNEKFETEPRNLYAATKNAFEMCLEYYKCFRNVRFKTVYLYDSFGDNDNRKKLLSAIKETKNNKKILEMTSGDQYINLLHIEEVVDGLTYTLQNFDQLSEEKISIRNKNFIKIKELIGVIKDEIGVEINVKLGALPNRENDEIALPKIKIVNGWKQKIDLTERLREYFEE